MNRLAKIYITRLLVTAAVGSTAVALFSPRGLNLSYGPSPRCQALVEPEKEQLTSYCRGKNNRPIENLVLREIYQQRETRLLENNCNPDLEQWHCERDYQLAGEYREIFLKQF